MWYVANDILHDYQLAEDATHEAFLNIAKNFKHVRTDEPRETTAFVITVTSNVAKRMYKKRQNHIIFSEADIDGEVFKDPIDYEQKTIDNTLYFQLKKLLPKIDYKYQTVLELYEQGYTYDQIASFLDVSSSTVRGRISYAKRLACKLLEEQK